MVFGLPFYFYRKVSLELPKRESVILKKNTMQGFPDMRKPMRIPKPPNVYFNVYPECKHPDIQCDFCKSMIHNGVRYKCLLCKDFDFCQDCESIFSFSHFQGSHAFAKIKNSNIQWIHKR